jgi:hypothetical protein
MLLYLNQHTFSRPQLIEELRMMQSKGGAIVMTHENDGERGGCEFDAIFSATPQDLIDNKLYGPLAIALHPGEYRVVSMRLLARALGAQLGDSACCDSRLLDGGPWGAGCSSMLYSMAQQLAKRWNSAARTGTYGCDDERTRPVVLLAEQDAQSVHESALSQQELGNLEIHDVALAQLAGALLEPGSSRRDQRRWSSALSAASSVSRCYRVLDDGMEVAQAGL